MFFANVEIYKYLLLPETGKACKNVSDRRRNDAEITTFLFSCGNHLSVRAWVPLSCFPPSFDSKFRRRLVQLGGR